jgi:RNA polymerase sigma factor (sigma-70 family)
MRDSTAADEELAQLVRDGDETAFGILWERHARAGRSAARQFANLADPDDLVSEAYLRILGALQRGGGPREAFRPYLYRTIRNVALNQQRSDTPVSLELVGDLLDPAADPESVTVRNTITARAFRTLPERWQTVLWYTEVEGMEPAEAAPYLGLSANSVAALAYRAREGLRKAWLQAHVSDLRVPPGCRWTTERMSDYVRGALTARARLRFDQHLDTCTRCSIIVEEVDDLGQRLAVVLLPLVLGGVAATGFLAARTTTTGQASATSASSGAVAASRSAFRVPGRVAVAVGAAAAIATIVTAAIAVPLLTQPAPPTADSAPTDPPTPTPPSPSPTPTPEPEPESESESEPEAEPPRPSSPPPPVVAPVDVEAPATVGVSAPVAGAVGNDPQPTFRGSGEPGARVDLERVSGPGTPGALASVIVASGGTWSVALPTLADGTHVVRVTQVDAAGNRSPAVDVPFVVDTVALPPTLDPLTGSYELLPDVTGTAEPGAFVEVRHSDGRVLGTTYADSAGAWSLALSDPGPDPVAIGAVQTDPAGNTSSASDPEPLTLLRPEIVTPADGATIASTGGATSVEVHFDGIEGRRIEVLVDGVSTGNIHTLEADPIVRVTAPLSDGEHTVAVRYIDPDTGRVGALTTVTFTIAP